MQQIDIDVAVVGGGPAGLSAALAASEQGSSVVIIERNVELGGILQQCIHHGFGIHRFKEELTGPEYAQRFISLVNPSDIGVLLETMVMEVTPELTIYAVNNRDGMIRIQAKAVVLAMGCRERTRGNLRIPGQRPAGVLTAGTAQRFVNIEGYMPGRKAVILGSGDIGLIMARRYTLEGAEVEAVVEIMPYAAGLTRNVVQCLDDFGIPLYLSSTIVDIHGRERVEGVTIAQVDPQWQPISGTERDVECDSLLLSVGLIPENELSQQLGVRLDPLTNGARVDHTLMTTVPGVFACGNVLHVHDLVDFVSQEAEVAGRMAARWTQTQVGASRQKISVEPGDNVRYCLPHSLSLDEESTLFMRVQQPEQDVCVEVGGIYRKKHRIVKPSEMIQVTLTPKMLATLRSDTLKVSVRKEDKAVG